MTDLDTLARAATQELLERSTPDVRSRYADLRRARSRRTAAKLGAASLAVALAAAGWQLASSPGPVPQPAPQPTKVVNGALLAANAAGTWLTVAGHPPAFHPRDSARWAKVQFTGHGQSVVYQNARDQIAILDVTTGDEQVLAPCPPSTRCESSSLSPDGRVLAFGYDEGVGLMQVATGEVERLAPPSVGATYLPTWSPDGRTLAFISGRGLYSMDADGTHVELLHRASGRASVLQSLSWSPDGEQIAFLEGTPIPGSIQRGMGDDRFTAMTVSVADHAVTELHDAGHCYCLGLAPPSLAWSPDGQLIAVATTKGMLGGPGDRAVGVYLVHPGGTGWTQVSGGLFDALAWQPVID